MPAPPAVAPRRDSVQSDSIPYIAPFAVFIAFLALERVIPVDPGRLYLVRFATVLATMVALSSRTIKLRTSNFLGSALLGVAVFVIWVGPDLVWPGYRNHWLFQNPLTGHVASSLPEYLRTNPAFLSMRVVSSAVLVPILEELFWRAWMMRWLISRNFESIPLGAYTRSSFWIVALLFASEHGPYWEVGLLAGIAYNWWMVRTKNLGNCILAHAITNACLAVFVLTRGQWQYWL